MQGGEGLRPFPPAAVNGGALSFPAYEYIMQQRTMQAFLARFVVFLSQLLRLTKDVI